jgi:hypothetical protein
MTLNPFMQLLQNPFGPDEDEYMRQPLEVWELKSVARSYGFTPKELHALLRGRSAAEFTRILHAHEEWRERNGLPAKNSGLSRGHLQDMLRGVA